MAAGSFYYDTDNDNSTREFFPLDAGAYVAATTARATAVMCILDFDDFGTMDCDTNLPDPDDGAATVLITLLGYGYSDCVDADASGAIENDEIPSCTGAATVSIPLTSLWVRPQISLSTTSFSRLWQLSKSCIPGPETLLIPESAAKVAPIEVSKPAWASSCLASLMPM